MTEQAREGMTGEQIAAAYIEKYGEQYRPAPAKKGFDLLIWILPAVLFAAATAFLCIFLMSQKERAEETAAEQPQDEYRERIEKELKERRTV